jgi:HAD superfamily hydrolase (TIGR01509 family)
MSESTHSLPRAVLFDMDGTLTCPMLDFPKIKAQMGIGNRPILEALAEMQAADRVAAEAILLRHEEEAAANSTLNPGCRELLDALSARHILTALITRNSRTSVSTVLSRHDLKIEVLVTREDAAPKPDPQPLLLGCRRLRISREEAWMVGDGQYDIEAGHDADIRTVWLSHGRDRFFEAEPWRTVRDLHELRSLLET